MVRVVLAYVRRGGTSRRDEKNADLPGPADVSRGGQSNLQGRLQCFGGNIASEVGSLETDLVDG